jgi:hypothetical protein
MAGSFFVQDGYGTSTTTTFEELVTQVIADAGAIGPKSATLINPTGSENLTLFYVNAATTVQQLTASVRGTSPSITVDVFYAPTPAASGTSLVTGGVTVTDTTITTSFSNAVIPANSYVRLATSAKSGTVSELAVSLDF